MVENGGYTNLSTSTILEEKYIGPIVEAEGYALYMGNKRFMPDDLERALLRGPILLKRTTASYTDYVGLQLVIYSSNDIIIRFLDGPQGLTEYYYLRSDPDYGFLRFLKQEPA